MKYIYIMEEMYFIIYNELTGKMQFNLNVSKL